MVSTWGISSIHFLSERTLCCQYQTKLTTLLLCICMEKVFVMVLPFAEGSDAYVSSSGAPNLEVPGSSMTADHERKLCAVALQERDTEHASSIALVKSNFNPARPTLLIALRGLTAAFRAGR